MKSKAAIQLEPGGPLVVEEIDIPDPGPNQVMVRNFASGACYSRVHQLHNAELPWNRETFSDEPSSSSEQISSVSMLMSGVLSSSGH